MCFNAFLLRLYESDKNFGGGGVNNIKYKIAKKGGKRGQ